LYIREAETGHLLASFHDQKKKNKIFADLFISLDLREMQWEDVDWIHLDQERNQLQAVVNIVMNLRVS
jgi:hypothetical protein